MNQAIRQHTFPSGQVLELVQGDITLERTEAIVNAANRYLEHGSGVAGAIVRRGGPQVQAESTRWVREHGLVTHGEPAYTTAGNLPCKYVIHAVGPIWGEGEEDEKLFAAVRGSLLLADRLGLGSLSMPAISTGIYRFPKPRAAWVMLTTTLDYTSANPASILKLIRLVIYDFDTIEEFIQVWDADDHLRA